MNKRENFQVSGLPAVAKGMGAKAGVRLARRSKGDGGEGGFQVSGSRGYLDGLLLSILCLWSSVLPAQADVTNTWHFTNASDYVLSDPTVIAINTAGSGSNQLVLQAQSIYHTAIDEYSNAASASLINFGRDLSFCLSGTPGAYNPAGTFTSRLFDGGAGVRWDMLQFKAGNRDYVPDPNLLALYRMENDNWLDYVTGQYASPTGAPTFTTMAKVGSYAGNFRGPGTPDAVITRNAALLNGKRAWSVAFWLRLDTFTHIGGLVTGYGPSGQILFMNQALWLPGTYDKGLWFGPYDGDINTIARCPNTIDTNVWEFVVGVWDGAGDGLSRLYVNGTLVGSSVAAKNTPLAQSQAFDIGFDPWLSNDRHTDGIMDEVGIWSRALSSNEVAQLYKSYAMTYPLRFQARSGTSPADVLTKTFVGSDGTPDTYFSNEKEKLVSCADFSISNRYAQYRSYLYSSTNNYLTPYVEAAAFVDQYCNVYFDNTLYDLQRGEYTANTTYIPQDKDTPYVGLALKANGGYPTNGAYLSRVFDAGGVVNWGVISWEAGRELDSTLPGLVGLWRLNDGSWAPAKGSTFGGGTATVTPFAKLGAGSAVFDEAANNHVAFPVATSVQAIELWANPENVSDGLVDITYNGASKVYITITNRMVVVSGPAGTVPTLTVNGDSQSPKLLSGWNHICVSFQNALAMDDIDIGVAGTDYFKGKLDELAIYNRAVTRAEADAHYVAGRRGIAGQVRAQARAGATTNLVGAFGAPVANGQVLGLIGRYLQYRLILDSDGEATPAVNSVTLNHSTGSFMDDTRGEIVQGTFESSLTGWYGEDIKLDELGSLGPVNLNLDTDSSAQALYHFDEPVWSGAASILDSKRGVSGNGTVSSSGANTSAGSAAGTRCGSFDGVAGFASLVGGFDLWADFTISVWFNTASASREALISTDDGNQYYTIEVNGNGIGPDVGKVTFVISDGLPVRERYVTASRTGLNDGRWHNVVGVRRGSQIHIYIDGDRLGTTNIGAAYGGAGIGAPFVGKRGTQIPEYFFSGLADEVAIWNRALAEAEIGQNAAGPFRTQGTGEYVSAIITNDAGPAIWQTLFWMPDAPYSKPLSVSDPTLMALWRLEEAGNPVTNLVASNNGNFNGAGWGASGRFGGCLSFNGTSDFVTVPHDVTGRLNPAKLTIEAWVNLDDAVSRAVVDKLNVSGYLLGTDAGGKPYFRVAGTICTGYLPVRAGKWTHLAGTYDSPWLKLYVDGEIAGMVNSVGLNTAAALASFNVGRNQAASGYLAGLVDEVAIHNRALSSEEIFDHYRAGAMTLKLQGRASNNPSFPSVDYTGPGMVTNTFFTTSSGDDMVGDVALAQYFQYRAYIGTENAKLTPRLSGIKVFVSSYPSANPSTEPTAGAGFTFLGNLVGFSNVRTFNPQADVQYQISGDNGASPRWYYWNVVQTQWQERIGPDLFGANTSPRADIGANIVSFYEQLYAKVGGLFRFKEFLHSEGDQQMAVDKVDLVAAAGRVVVTAPNGAETGTAAWVSSVPYDITWTSAGVVSGNLNIDLYDQSGALLVGSLTNNTPNTGVARLVISATPGTNYRVRVWDPNSASIYDTSDNDFWLVEEFHLTAPDGGEYWRIGTTQQVKWDSPSAGVAPQVDLWLTYDGDNWDSNVSAWTKVVDNLPNVMPGNNTYNWLIPSNDWRLVSEEARMAVVPHGIPNPLVGWPLGAKRDFSDRNFTNAGIVVTYPTLNAGIRSGNTVGIRWTAAGVGPTAVIRLYNGAVWSVLGTNVCVAGTNNLFNAPLVGRTTNAFIEVSSGGLVGLSAPFTLADVNIVAPVGGAEAVRSHWQIDTTNDILWTSSGAGSNVAVRYTSSELSGVWVVITNNFANNDSGFVTNRLPWIIPGPPSGTVTVRVESVNQADLYAEAGPFSMAGVQITAPVGAQTWDLTAANRVEWLSRDGASVANIAVSFDSGANFESITNPPAYSQNGSNFDTVAFGAIRRPSDRARLRLRENHQTLPAVVFTDVMDADFYIRGIAMSYPSNGMTVNLGRTAANGLQWFSALTLRGNAQLYYSPDGVTYSGAILRPDGLSFDFPNTDNGTCSNAYNWNVERSFKPSTAARVKVVAGTYSAITPPFTMRGVRITSPAAGENVGIGVTKLVTWDYAAVAGAGQASNFVSLTGTNGPFARYGFTNDSQIDFGGVNWTVDPDADPTTNAVIRMQVFWPAPDADVVAMSQPFTLRGLKITSPSVGLNWPLGSAAPVSFLAAGMGVGAKASVYYATNSTDFDLANPVTNNLTVVDGVNSFTWDIENSSALTRMPSTNAHVMIACAGFTNVSRAFTLSGIKIVKPLAGDVWAVSDGTNDIEWVSVGAPGPYALSFTVYAGTNGSLTYPHTESITPGWGASPYPWAMVFNSVGKPVTVQVVGGGFSNESEPFEVVPQPSIRIRNPVPGDFWKVSETNMIEWVRGGDMDNNFRILATYADGSTSQLGVDGAFPLNAGVFSYQWRTIPADKLGPATLVVTNLTNPDVWSVCTNLVIAPRFDIDTFTETLYALKDYRFFFTTRGAVADGVDFYYSVDPNRSPSNWVHINTEGPMTVANDASLSYNWPVPDPDPYHRTATPWLTWLRVQDHAYSNQVFQADRPGPYNDYGMFSINYFRVIWYVYDAVTTQQLDRLSVVENLGRSYSDLRSPWTNYYPYGSWESVWYREYFNDKPVLEWEPASSPSNVVYLTRSDVEPDYHVMADFAYNVSNRTFTINAWLERRGMILQAPDQCVVSIYRSSGQLMETLTDTAPDGNGVFWVPWDVSMTESNRGVIFSSTEVFFGKVDIDYSRLTYSAGLTFALRMAAAEEQVAAIEAIINASEGRIRTDVAGVNANVSNVGSNVSSVGSDLASFRGEVLAGLSSNLTMLGLTTSMMATVSAGMGDMTNVLMPAMNSLSNQISILGPSVSNLANSVTNVQADLVSDRARILTRPTSIQYGTTNTFLYKTRPGYDPSTVSIRVRDNAGTQVDSGTMTEIVGGIYQRDLVANWGTNRFIIHCSDPLANDSMVVQVVAEGNLDAVPSQISSLGAQLSQVQNALTNITSLVSGIQGADLGGVMAGLASIENAMQGVDLSQINLSGLARIEAQLGQSTDSSSSSTFFGRLSAISSQIESVGGTAQGASRNAQAAKTQASAAASGIAGLMTAIEDGDLQGALTRLEEIKTALTSANENVREIPRLLPMTGAVDALNKMAGQINDLAESKGWSTLLNPEQLAEGEGLSGDVIDKLNSNMAEVRSSMEFLTKILDEQRTEPVVQEELMAVP